MTEPSPSDEFHINHLEYCSLSYAITLAIAVLENTEVTEVTPLYEAIDPEALDRVFRRATEHEQQVAVEFRLDQYTVHAESDGTLTVVDESPTPDSHH